MDERMKFIADLLRDENSMAELCRQFGISRKTGYKWLQRYNRDGPSGLENHSSARLCQDRVDAQTQADIITCKINNMNLGPKKIRVLLQRTQPDRPWPSVSSIAAILKQAGLVKKRRKRLHATPSSQPLCHAVEANQVWLTDFKGWFRTGEGIRCTPLTIVDASSRYLLRCHNLTGSTGYEQVRALFEMTFRQFGLPERIRSDNGPPFAGTGLCGLSRLSVWWMCLGIIPERIQPGHPEQNGRIERFHRTLKEAAISPPAATARAQQRAFDSFADHYNHVRPHESLGQRTPATLYRPSSRIFTGRPPRLPEYPRGWLVRKVKPGKGEIKWRGKLIYISEALGGHNIGLQPLDNGDWSLHFINTNLGVLRERQGKADFIRKKARRRVK